MLEKTDIEKIEKMYRDFISIHDSFNSRNSKSYNDYLRLAKHAMKEGSIPKKYKELMAVSIAACVNCEPCIVWHLTEAVNNGATDEEIIEAIEVAVEMGGGPVVGKSSFTFKVLEYIRTKK
jgi:AhpD family alkylhydroperoxidase